MISFLYHMIENIFQTTRLVKSKLHSTFKQVFNPLFNLCKEEIDLYKPANDPRTANDPQTANESEIVL